MDSLKPILPLSSQTNIPPEFGQQKEEVRKKLIEIFSNNNILNVKVMPLLYGNRILIEAKSENQIQKIVDVLKANGLNTEDKGKNKVANGTFDGMLLFVEQEIRFYPCK